MKKTSKTKFGTTHINMIDSVVAFVFAAANLSITQSMAAWEEMMNVLKSNLQSIRNMQQTAGQVITGYASQKQSAKTALVEMSTAIMRSVYSFAVLSNNQVLANAMYTTRTALKSKKYNDLITDTQQAIDLVTPLISQLSDYNITTTLVNQWQSANTLLLNLLSGPNNAISTRKSINQDIQALLHSSVYLLDNQADGMALNFANNPATVTYYNTYLANRKLKPYGHVPTQLRAYTVNDTNAPVQSHIQIEGTQISADTQNGYALLTGIPFGLRNVLITVGTTTYTFPITFKKGQSHTQTFNVEQGFIVPEPTSETVNS